MILGIIPARAGSKRLPGKNTRPLCGKPLIAWTIEAALTCGALDEVMVSTDDPTVMDIAADWGATYDRRPDWLATDTASIYDVVRYHLKMRPVSQRPDHVMLLQPTSPLRTAEDIDAMIGRWDSRVEHSPGIQSRAANAVLANGAMYCAPVVCWTGRKFRFDDAPYLQWFDMPPERSIDINTLEDFEACERYMKEHGWA